jgi:hypothetical protein
MTALALTLDLMPAEVLLLGMTSGLIVALMLANSWLKRIRARDARDRKAG